MDFYYKKIFKELSKKYNVPYKDVKEAYYSVYHFIEDKTKELDYNNRHDLTEEEFNSEYRGFSLPFIGKIYADYKSYKKLKRMRKYYIENIQDGRVQDKND